MLEYLGFVTICRSEGISNKYTVVFPADSDFKVGVSFKTRTNPVTQEKYQLLKPIGALAALHSSLALFCTDDWGYNPV